MNDIFGAFCTSVGIITRSDRTPASVPGIPDVSLDRLAQPNGHQIPDGQRVIAASILGGLHHEYRLEPVAA
jgi:hypothetical protein